MPLEPIRNPHYGYIVYAEISARKKISPISSMPAVGEKFFHNFFFVQ